MLSNLSNTPPCPGIILPKSFILNFLLIAEKNKSPNCPIKVKNNTIIDTLNSGKDVLIDGLHISSDNYRKCVEDSPQIEIFNYKFFI